MPETHVKAGALVPGESFRLPSGADTYRVLSVQAMLAPPRLSFRVSYVGSFIPLAKPVELHSRDTVILVDA